MTPKRKARWIAALRSERYRQTTMRLYKDGAYCCLGVECDLTLGKKSSSAELTEGWRNCLRKWPVKYRLSAKVSRDVMNNLARMNDEGKSFSAIADWIETHDLETGEPLP